jgi:Domain found in Dishevelled, Egl-10, and Pleckstrin (DEP)
MQGTVLLIQDNKLQETLLSTAFLSNNFSVRKIRKTEALLPQLHNEMAKIKGPVLVCADLARLAKDNLIWPQFAQIVKGISKDSGLLATTSKQLMPTAIERNWIKKHGGYDLIGNISQHRIQQSFTPLFNVARDFFAIEPDMVRLNDYLNVILNSSGEDECYFCNYHKIWARLEGLGQTPDTIAELMQKSPTVASQDRTYRLKKYPSCFLGSEANQWLSETLGLSSNQAVEIGELLRAMGYFYHVVKQQPFLNGNFFYRFSLPSQSMQLIDIDRIIEEGHLLRGFDIQDRKWRGIAFPKTFIGSETTKWLATFYGLGMQRALLTGQTLQDLFIFRHVSEEHDFIDGDFYYRLTRDQQYKL